MAEWSARRPLLRGFLALGLGLGGVAVWAGVTQIGGAVIAPGMVAVEARRQLVQHPDGGLVAAIHVRDGDRVAAGDPILALDGTELVAQRALDAREGFELGARLARLGAEVRGAGALRFPDAMRAAAAADPDRAQVLADETALFVGRRDTLAQTLAQIAERQVQTRASIAGRERQLEAAREQLALARQDLADQADLLAQGLTQTARVTALRREAAEIQGRIGELEAGIAEARSQIAGYEIEALRIAAEWREAAQTELRELQPRAAELRERLRVTETRLGRLVLRAPMAGRVHDLKAFTVGGVIAPGAEVAAIVPADAARILVVEIAPAEIDRVSAGQTARIRFPSFNARTTPEVTGRLRTVSADVLSDPNTGRSWYSAEIVLTEEAEAALAGLDILPGMPVESFIETGARSPASYLVKPVSDYLTRAMREE
ncbi:MAG: HlyD family type I secretion periplasmic adaptor subunit [Rhodobacteraceae bacterium]|jgi:HlyD family type I secretion membrane fusion protein|nr:HlyD family type I secretion periplasmic adaptor subunit [Paracoccaceae bacterium]